MRLVGHAYHARFPGRRSCRGQLLSRQRGIDAEGVWSSFFLAGCHNSAMNVDDFRLRFGVEWIYHFTDEANLPSIQRLGLYNYSYLTRRNFVVRPGGDQSSHDYDARSGYDKYVHLCFVKDHPMAHVAVREGRIANLVWLEVSYKVLRYWGTRGCRTLANTRNVPVLPIEEALDVINLKKLFSEECSTETRKAQILVYGYVPPKMLRIASDG